MLTQGSTVRPPYETLVKCLVYIFDLGVIYLSMQYVGRPNAGVEVTLEFVSLRKQLEKREIFLPESLYIDHTGNLN